MNTALNDKLIELEKVNSEIEKLEDNKKEIRREILELMKNANMHETFILLNEKKYRLKWNSTSKVIYDDAVLKERFGNKILSILKVDYNKFKKYSNLNQYFPAEVLKEIGSVSKDLVKIAVQNGEFTVKDFAGAFSKDEKETLYVSVFENNDM